LRNQVPSEKSAKHDTSGSNHPLIETSPTLLHSEDGEFYDRSLHYSGPFSQNNGGRSNKNPPRKRGHRYNERMLLGQKLRPELSLKSSQQQSPLRAVPTTSLVDIQDSTTRYYIYDDPAITMSVLVESRRAMGKGGYEAPSKLDHVLTDARAERDVMRALEVHPLRTMDVNEATVFVIPTPMSELLAYGCQWEECTWYDQVFDALLSHPIYQGTGGHRHVLINFNWLSFDMRMSSFIPALSRNFRRIENVTVANHYDPFGCLELTRRIMGEKQQQQQQQQQQNEHAVEPFHYLFPIELPVTKSFSIGLGVGNTFAIHPPTFQKFVDSENFLFYHSRGPEAPFAFGSTPYRMAALNDTVIAALPASSIGFDITKDEWMRAFVSSQYCLVVRGDTPHSHAMINAVRAGCIPVVVSDYYEEYAAPFKSTLSMHDFCFILDEQKFLADPTKELLVLKSLPDEVIKAKLLNLTLAQQVVLPDHQHSWFVNAFLKETLAVDERYVPDVYTRVPVQVETDATIISGRRVGYRFPSTFADAALEDGGDSDSDSLLLITGIISTASHHNRRHAIRGTWAASSSDDTTRRIFFVVSGPWHEIEREFLEHGDMLWLEDMDEGRQFLTYKTQVFFSAVDTHIALYDYIFMTHDDSYAGLDALQRIAQTRKPDYWGHCAEDVSCLFEYQFGCHNKLSFDVH
jgi:hypothetical protein